MSPWGWKPDRNEGVWRHGALWTRPFVMAAPWITLLLLVLMFWVVGGVLTSAKGVLFDLPEAEADVDGEVTRMVALVMPVERDTLVFFDDSRFMLGDAQSTQSLLEQLSDRVSRDDRKALLALADRRVPTGDLMRFAAIVRKSGVKKILFAEKRSDVQE